VGSNPTPSAAAPPLNSTNTSHDLSRPVSLGVAESPRRFTVRGRIGGPCGVVLAVACTETRLTSGS
jgi:hypothetical protein